MAKSKKTSPVIAAIGVVALGLVAGFGGSLIQSSTSRSSGANASESASAGSWIKEIQQRGELRVACADSPPTSSVAADGTCDGPVMLPFKELAEALEVKYVPVGTTYQSIIAGLQAGKYDVAANIDATMARTLAVRFTDAAWTYEGVFVLPKDKADQYPDAEAILGGKEPISTAQGTSFDQALALQDLKVEPVLLATYQDAAQAVKAGRAAALFTDIGSAVTYAKDDSKFCVLVPEPPLVTNEVVNGVSPGIDEHSLQTVNFAINDSVRQGRFQAAMEGAGYIGETNLGSLAC